MDTTRTADTTDTGVPLGGQSPTPLLVLFDAEVWLGMGLPAQLDSLIAKGYLPPLHVALVSAVDMQTRHSTLGVPGGQVDAVIDRILPAVRAGWAVSPRGSDTIAAGQSLGGIAALWLLALSAGAVQHAIPQSPSLWRFNIHEVMATSTWESITLQVGNLEGDMEDHSRALHTALHASGTVRTAGTVHHPSDLAPAPAAAGTASAGTASAGADSAGAALAPTRTLSLEVFDAGHDWAAWRANLLTALHDLSVRLGYLAS